MLLSAGAGAIVDLEVTGEDEEQAIESMAQLFESDPTEQDLLDEDETSA
jgi:phosphotransferase system HPr-like phosphotransfer protein